MAERSMMNDFEFDKRYWEEHWQGRPSAGPASPTHPYLAEELGDLTPGTALDAGCGTGAEAVWLAERGWQVTGADISAAALAAAADRGNASPAVERLRWQEADLMTWEPAQTWDLVVTSYAHPPQGQLAFYQRIAKWVAPTGTLLIVGHRHGHQHEESAQEQFPETATAELDAVTALFAGPDWSLVTARENSRMTSAHGPEGLTLHDFIVCARRN